VRCFLCGVWFKRVWGSKKEGVRGTKMLKRNRSIPGAPTVLVSVCPECEDVVKLVKGVDSWR